MGIGSSKGLVLGDEDYDEEEEETEKEDPDTDSEGETEEKNETGDDDEEDVLASKKKDAEEAPPAGGTSSRSSTASSDTAIPSYVGTTSTTAVKDSALAAPAAGGKSTSSDASAAPAQPARMPQKIKDAPLGSEYDKDREKEIVWRKLVYKHTKDKQQEDDTPKEEDELGEFVPTLAEHASNIMGFGSASLSIVNAAHADKNAIKAPGASDEQMDAANELSNTMGLFSGLIGTGLGAMDMFSNISKFKKDRRGNNQNKARQSFFKSIIGGTGALSGLFQTGSAISGLAGASGASGGLGIASSVTDVFGSLVDIHASRSNAAHHRNILGAMQDDYNGNNEFVAKDQSDYQQARSDYKRNRTDVNKKARDSEKAKFYSMRMASHFASNTAKQESTNAVLKGVFGLGSTLMGLGSGIGALAGKTPGESGYASGILGILGGITKYAGKAANAIADSHYKKSNKRSKDIFMKDYIDEKKKKISAEAGGIQELAGVSLSPTVCEKIAYLRLGADVDLSDDRSDITDDIYNAAFNRLALKRANNILNSEDNLRHKMLTALGLGDHATPEEVAEMLGYEK